MGLRRERLNASAAVGGGGVGLKRPGTTVAAGMLLRVTVVAV
ncbi:hypothetical protein SAMN05444273_1162 [Litoreibacter ascidiaceicola]|uniref:Uncharacterized protein n=1 Tax=Litoreibacter ascidiaceicola TaxID=1486859 RepID=A0A1M5EWC9_9RHOB|nr:hypothetical protein [Litoreibacter ascidiaceicola]SHF83545.1 hypothetical protein SAMN05444273_1162 [Litoreibacter ascidiaceicola]